MVKQQRNYIITIETRDGKIIEIRPPFTVEIDVNRNIMSRASSCNVRIYNLSKEIRNSIYKDIYDAGTIKKFTLRAGYGEVMPVIFNGNVSRCSSVKENTNIITSIECFDGGFAFANAQTSANYEKGAGYNSILESLMKSLPGVAIGALGSYPGNLPRSNTFSGNTTDLIKDISNGGFFVDLGKSYCLNEDECIRGAIQEFDSSAGLLGTPVKEQSNLTFDIVFDPRLIIGQLISLKSTSAEHLNGQYKVLAIHHRGVISDSVGGPLITTLGMFHGKAFTVVG